MKLRPNGFAVLAALAMFAFGGLGALSLAAEKKAVRIDETLSGGSFDQWQKSLAEERAILERQAERQYSGVEKLIDKILWVFGVVATSVLGFFVWFFGKSRRDFEKSISATFEKQAQEIVEKEAQQLRQRYDNLKAEVEDLSAYKLRQVTWVDKGDVLSEDGAANTVLKALYAAGLRNISFITPEMNTEFDLGDPDLVILTFDGSDEGRRILSVLVRNLKQKSPPVPLLIYTFSSSGGQVLLETSELKILSGFHWYIPVNFPAQLLAQTQLLIRRSRSLLGENRGNV